MNPERQSHERPSPSTPEDTDIRKIPLRIAVFSGKGGVGKTTLAVNLAIVFARGGARTGLLDADITGPNVPKMMGITEPARAAGDRGVPHQKYGVRVVSLATMLPPDTPVIWRGPMRSKAIEELLQLTDWGELDVLLLDLPPGTGDEILTIAQTVRPQIALVVTTPQEVARMDARRAVGFARKLDIPHIALVENMSGFTCPHCGEPIALFGSDTTSRDAAMLKVDFLGAIPLDPEAPRRGDTGVPAVVETPDAPMSEALSRIAEAITASHPRNGDRLS